MAFGQNPAASLRGSGWRRAAIVVAAVLVALVLLVVFFPWDATRGPIGRYVSEKTGRHFAITRRLSVSLGGTTRVHAEGVEFANPSWASDPWPIRSDVVDLQVRMWPLLHGQLVLPSLSLQHAESGLHELPDGRRTWDLSRPGSKPSSKSQVPAIGRLAVDDGRLHYLAPAQRIDVQAHFSMQPDPADASKALAVQADGRFRDQPFHATGHAGDVLRVVQGEQKPFPAEMWIEAASTRMHVVGTVAHLVPVGGISADVDVQGRSLADLYHVTGVVLPAPLMAVTGRLDRRDYGARARSCALFDPFDGQERPPDLDEQFGVFSDERRAPPGQAITRAASSGRIRSSW